ncbi:MAG: hypothetical protein F6J87_24635 [Spirulina sp. SIO3F2]|nr:hypothetical protein [Spirulina sp. SIO3F2]
MSSSNLTKIQEIWNRAGVLTNVYAAIFNSDPEFITALSFDLSSTSMTLQVESCYDEVIVNGHPLVLEKDETVIDVSHKSPWKNALGQRMRWVWLLTNQQGYEDGIRIEFTNPDEKTQITTCLIVCASRICIIN